MVILSNTNTKKEVMLESGYVLTLKKLHIGWGMSKSYYGKEANINEYDIAIAQRVFEIKEPIHEI
jgi:hypothetical protein